MDSLTFISNLARDLAWPITTLVVLIIALRQLPNLRRFVKAIRYKDMEVTLREEFDGAREVAETVKALTGPETKPEETQTDRIVQLAQIDPAIALIEIWRKLETEVVSLIQHNGLMRYTSPVKLVEQLGKIGKLSEEEVTLFRRLREIRNVSVHAQDTNAVTLAEVIEFRDFVNVLIRKFDQIKNEPGYIDIPNS